MNLSRVTTVVVHNGIMHADDIFCVAFVIKYINPIAQYLRVSEVTDTMIDDPSYLICDIGGGRFDHHQDDAYVDKYGHKWCSFELLLDAYLNEYLPSIHKDNAPFFVEVMNKLAESIGRCDNGEFSSTVCNMFNTYNPEWNTEDKEQTIAYNFRQAVGAAMRFMENLNKFTDSIERNIVESDTEKYKASVDADKYVSTAMKNSLNGIVFLDDYAPWEKTLCADESVKFVIYPSMRGGWALQCVPPFAGSFEQRIPLPEAVETRKADGCIFAHTARFLATFETREQAKNFALSLTED